MQGVVNFFGRISILIDQNTQAFHMFMTALLQVLLHHSVSTLCNFVYLLIIYPPPIYYGCLKIEIKVKNEIMHALFVCFQLLRSFCFGEAYTIIGFEFFF